MNKYQSIIRFFALSTICCYALAANIPNDHTQIECEIIPIGYQDSAIHHYSHPHIAHKSPLYFLAYSTNWSGYVAATNLTKPAAKSVNTVSGSWTVPSIKNVGSTTYCSIWVGIDGYNSGTVEQIGTEHDWSNGVQRNYAWFEMYPLGSYMINNFPVNVGDTISAYVEYYENGIFILNISNNTRKVTTTIPTAYTKSLTAQRESAEWVVEAPYENAILPLSDFKTITFSNCQATINNLSEKLNPKAWANSPIEMETTKDIAKAVPSTVNNGSFSVAWDHV